MTINGFITTMFIIIFAKDLMTMSTLQDVNRPNHRKKVTRFKTAVRWQPIPKKAQTHTDKKNKKNKKKARKFF